MRRKGPLSRLVLPSDVNPSTSTCFAVNVPNDPQHIAAFKGAIYRLSKPYTWADDDAHTALDVAAVWRTIFDNLGNCDMIEMRNKPTDSCVLQLSLDGGDTWADVADFRDCAEGAAKDVIQQKIDDGSLSGGSQPGGIGDGVLGQCYDYDVTLRGSDKWISPVKMSGGDTIQVTSVKGAWQDGTFGGTWNCADGHAYALGGCLIGGQATDEDDPAPSIYHMRLIGGYGETPTYFDAYETTFDIPIETGDVDVILQVNDSDIADNAGSVTFHVQICKSFWSVDFDFTLDDYSWAPQSFPDTAAWTSGIGWHQVGTTELCYIKFVAGAACALQHFDADFETNSGYASYAGADIALITTGGTVTLHRDNSVAVSPGGNISWDGNQAVAYHDTFLAQISVKADGSYSRVVRARLSGRGPNPFM